MPNPYNMGWSYRKNLELQNADISHPTFDGPWFGPMHVVCRKVGKAMTRNDKGKEIITRSPLDGKCALI